MCTYAIAFNAHEDYPFILFGNRDEFFNRPTQSAHFWKDYPNIYAGEDLIHHGTWLGINKNSRFAFLSNYRNRNHPINKRKKTLSRGIIVRHFLSSTKDIDIGWQKELLRQSQQSHGFNLIFGELFPQARLFYFNNINNEFKQLNPGVYAFSNNVVSDKPWPKSCDIQQRLQILLQQQLNKQSIIEAGFDILTSKKHYPKEKLPHDTGFPIDIEKQLSSIFVRVNDLEYGTRTSTVILIDRQYLVHYYEKHFKNKEYNSGTLNKTIFQLKTSVL